MNASQKEREIAEEYLSSLMDLNVNSKPLINMLTMLAEDNIEHADVIVRVVDQHLAKASPDIKLPVLYLVDSIVKNLGDKYKSEFAKNIVNMFCGCFEKVNEKVREKLFNLRQTWNEVFPMTKLYALDVKVNAMDNNWPITAKIGHPKVPKVHLNPNFLKNQPPEAQRAQEDINEQMRAKERELLELKKRKIELALLMGTNNMSTTTMIPPRPTVPLPLNPMADVPPMMPSNHSRTRIAPVSAPMIQSTRIRDPRLARETSKQSSSSSQSHPIHIFASNATKSLPRIPKLSQSARSSRDSEKDRDSRDRKDDSKSSSKSPRSRDKSSKSSSSSSRSSDRNKSSSKSDKKHDDDRKSSKSSSSHRSTTRSSRSKSPSRSSSEAKELQSSMRPDSTTGVNKDKLLTELLNGEENKSSQVTISSSENEHPEQTKDLDLRFPDIVGKKRSLGDDPMESEPLNKKNKAEDDTLFGNRDVDLRNMNIIDVDPEKKSKISNKANFEAVRAKLNARKDKNSGGVKFLNEFPSMPSSEAPVEHLKKILGRKDAAKSSIKPIEVDDDIAIVQAPPKQPRVDENQHSREKSDLGMTPAELRKNSEVPSLRKDKRRGTKWGEPNQPPPQIQSQWPASRPIINQPLPPVNLMTSTHFKNPLDNNPLVVAMRAQSQMPLVVPQSISQPILNSKLRTLRLDGTNDHLLRFYNETAIIFNDVGEPRDIRFSAGQCRVIIDDQFSIEMFFNDGYKPICIDNVLHRIKFGTPTRELYIDDNFYECYFNNQTTQIVLNDKIRMVRIEGNAPEVKIGVKRNDLVLGMINMVIDAITLIPVFLDTTVQYFENKGRINTLQFADFFLTVIINNEPFKVEYGDMPKAFILHGQKHFIRFTGLPDNIIPGRVNLYGMKRTHLFRTCRSPPIIEPLESIENSVDITKAIENDMRMSNPPPSMQMKAPPNSGIPGIASSGEVPELNINDLLQQLVKNGLIGTSTENSTATSIQSTTASVQKKIVKEKSPDMPKEVNKVQHSIRQVNLSIPETIKKRQAGIVDTLYSGIQCSSCGLRFPPEQTMKYSQHLDWHFRQNRRERDSKRKAHFRKWYYTQSDWIKYEEIEDAEDREKNFFETQQESSDGNDDGNSKNIRNNDTIAIVSCPADAEDVNRVCDMCHDGFEQFFNEETEEWHLRNAIKIDEKVYHPICYEDFKASLTLDETALMETNESFKNDENDQEISGDDVKVKEEQSEVIERPLFDNDDDDVIVLPHEEPVVTEIMDESEVIGESENIMNVTDDDVMIQEPKIETQIVPDDDDDDEPMGENSLQNFVVKIKEEPKDDGYEDAINEEEDPFVEVAEIAEDENEDEAFSNSPFRPALDDNAVFDDASLMMSSPTGDDDQLMEDESGSRAETNSNGAAAVVGGNKKLKIVLSSLVQNSITSKNLSNNVNDQNEKNENESVNKLELNSVDSQSEVHKDHQPSNESHEEPAIKYQVKPQLQGIKFEKIRKPVTRGIENSGLCSIM